MERKESNQTNKQNKEFSQVWINIYIISQNYGVFKK